MNDKRYKEALFVLKANSDFKYFLSVLLLKTGVLSTSANEEVRKIGLSILNDVLQVDEGTAKDILCNILTKE